MGNSSTKESRADHRRRGSLAPDQGSSSQQQYQGNERPVSRARNRSSRTDAGGLGGILGISSPQSATERRETRQEREARRLERERQQRLVERERSLREEHIDGGYLVTLGTYVGPEDYNKQVVRQLQIERKLAPFWRGLQDVDSNWAEHQIIAAARGLEIPPADQPPPDHLIPRPLSPESPEASTPNLNNLTVPIGGRSQSVASNKSDSNAGSALPSPTTASPAQGGSSPFKPRAKALAAAIISSRNGSTPDIVPREIHLANDPFVNGQPLEVYLYKNASECPICFLEYPPYLNHTRCCDQPICSECFVQIKRADPHYPEGHGDSPENAAVNPEEQAGMLISEPACCPYCQQSEFGVTFEPPHFRRGLAYSISPSTIGVNAATAMSSSSSLNSTLSPPLASPTPAGLSTGSRRRTQSLSVNAPNVITTDRVRPDWSTKLASQRAHIARRAAAATALHTAAFLMGNNETRGFRVSRFGRRTTVALSPIDGGNNLASASREAVDRTAATADAGGQDDNPEGGDPANPSDRRSRMDDLEELMFREALRQSLASEEERQRKSEKEARKDAKRREKQERKAAKAAAKGLSPYHGGSGASSASVSGSSLSLSGLGNRLRGNSGSNLRMEASVASAMAVGSSTMVNSVAGGTPSPNPSDKGKAVDRGTPQAESSTSESLSATASPSSTSAPRPVPTSQQSAGPSHLRQMSNASSVDSSPPGSYQNPPHLHDPRASGLSLGGRSEASEDADRQDNNDVGAESMFNFSSLAELVGVELEGENAGRRLSVIGREALKGKDAAESPGESGKDGEAEASHTEHDDGQVEDIDQSVATLRPGKITLDGNTADSSSKTERPSLAPPTFMITPETPAPDADESKQLGYGAETIERVNQVT